jgi:hypothetical protein
MAKSGMTVISPEWSATTCARATVRKPAICLKSSDDGHHAAALLEGDERLHAARSAPPCAPSNVALRPVMGARPRAIMCSERCQAIWSGKLKKVSSLKPRAPTGWHLAIVLAHLLEGERLSVRDAGAAWRRRCEGAERIANLLPEISPSWEAPFRFCSRSKSGGRGSGRLFND